MNLKVGDYLIVSSARPTCFSIYKDDGKTWVAQATLERGILKGVDDNAAFNKKTAKKINKAVQNHIMSL
jgi:hypothetical protein